MLLDFERFDLIKELLRSRLRLVWCTRLARAQDDEERARIEAEMAGTPDTAAILDALHATRATGVCVREGVGAGAGVWGGGERDRGRSTLPAAAS